LTPLSLLARTAAVYPHLTSVLYEGRSLKWAETYDRCRRLASCLVAFGISEGDTVAAMLPNVPAMHELHFAVPMAGAVLNALNLRLDAASIAFQLDHGSAKVIFVDPEFSGLIAEAIALMTGPKPLIVDVDDPACRAEAHLGEGGRGRELRLGKPPLNHLGKSRRKAHTSHPARPPSVSLCVAPHGGGSRNASSCTGGGNSPAL